MPPNNRRRKIKNDAVGRFLIKETGGTNEGGSSRRKAIKAASEFHEMPHMFQDAPDISEFISGDAKTMHLKSVLERNALDEFLDCSLSSQTLYNKQNAVRVLIKQSDQQMKTQQQNVLSKQSGSLWQRIVPIPRRPINYVSGKPETVLSPSELAQLESEAFLKWRLDLSKIEEQEGRVMTPFERNLEFWRQLWRVLERSDVVIQILDARNPLFFRSQDLEHYVKEIHEDKDVILLMNKSDLVPQEVRRTWAQWFRQHGVVCLFFSALEELKRQGVVVEDHFGEGHEDEKEDVEDEDVGNHSENSNSSDDEESEVERYPRKRIDFKAIQGSSSDEESSDEDSNNGDEVGPNSDSDGDDEKKELLEEKIEEKREETVEEKGVEEALECKVEENVDVYQGKGHEDSVDGSDLEEDRDSIAHEFVEVIDGESFEEYLWRVSASADVLNASQLLAVLQRVREIVLSRREIDGDGEESIMEEVEDDDEEESEEESEEEEEDDNEKDEDEPNEEEDGDMEKQKEKVSVQKGKKSKGVKKRMFIMRRHRDPSKFVVGLVGYPNVGKSSVINSVLGHKVVSVSRQPGKTKHFQTLPLPTVGMTLCDCPGLVFPQIISTKAHLVVNGVSPIDHVRGDFIAPIRIVCDIIPHSLIRQYNLNPSLLSIAPRPLNKPQIIKKNQMMRHHSTTNDDSAPLIFPTDERLDATQFLTLLANSRGYISGGKGGLPDLFQTAKFILRDFTTGKLLHWVLPPDSQPQGNVPATSTSPSLPIQHSTPQIASNSNLSQQPSNPEVKHEPDDDFLMDVLADRSSSSSTASGKKLTKRAIRQVQKQTVKGKSAQGVNIDDININQLKGLRGLASSGILNK